MKNNILLFLALFFPLFVYANNRDDFFITCDKSSLNLNEQLVCRISVNLDYVYNRIDFSIASNSGFEIVDIRSNYEKMWTISKDTSNNVFAVAKESQSGLQEFGIVLLKVNESGIHNLEFNNIQITNSKNNEIKEIKDVSTIFKVISTDNTLNNIKINGEDLSDFDVNKLDYIFEIGNDESINIEAITNSEFAKLSGTGEFELSLKVREFVFPITVKSEDGTSKIYVLNVIRKDFQNNEIDKKLDSIIVKNDKGNNVIFNFSPEIFEYIIEVSGDTKSLDITPILKNKEVSFVKKYGEQKIELVPGNNIVIIKVKDDEGQIQNYVLNITKPIANKSSNNYIKSLTIEDYKFEFNKRIKNYTLEINKKDKTLDIIPILESEKATYKISGNNDLKEGSVIKIVVTAENEATMTYKINIKIKEANYTFLGIMFFSIIAIGWVGLSFKNIFIAKLKERFNKNAKKKSKTKSKNNSAKKHSSTVKKSSIKNNENVVNSKKSTNSNKNISKGNKTTTKKNNKALDKNSTIVPKNGNTKINSTTKKSNNLSNKNITSVKSLANKKTLTTKKKTKKKKGAKKKK